MTDQHQNSLSEGATRVSDNGETETTANDGQGDVVKYETHRHLLGQHKKAKEENSNLRERLAAYEQKEKELAEQDAIRKGDFEKAMQLQKEEIERLREENFSYKRDFVDSSKISEFVKHLPGKIRNDKYFGFVDLDAIVIDDETGRPDEESVKLVAAKFMKEHGDLVDSSEKRKLPQHGAFRTSGYSQGPKSLKDMKTEDLKTILGQTMK